jgi:hypothetical protein
MQYAIALRRHPIPVNLDLQSAPKKQQHIKWLLVAFPFIKSIKRGHFQNLREKTPNILGFCTSYMGIPMET